MNTIIILNRGSWIRNGLFQAFTAHNRLCLILGPYLVSLKTEAGAH